MAFHHFNCVNMSGLSDSRWRNRRDDDRQADRRLGGSHGHHKKHDDLAVGRSQRASEGDEGQVDGVQHDLDRQQNRDQVAADETPAVPMANSTADSSRK